MAAQRGDDRLSLSRVTRDSHRRTSRRHRWRDPAVRRAASRGWSPGRPVARSPGRTRYGCTTESVEGNGPGSRRSGVPRVPVRAQAPRHAPTRLNHPGPRGRKRGRVVSSSRSSNTASTSSPTPMSSLAIPDEAGGEARTFLQLDLGDVVGNIAGEGRKPGLVHDHEGRDRAPSARRPPLEALAEAPRANGGRRQEGAPALHAPRQLQHVRAAPVPERAVVRGHPGLRLRRHVHVVSASFIDGRRSNRPTWSPTGGDSRPVSAARRPLRATGGRSPRSSSSRSRALPT